MVCTVLRLAPDDAVLTLEGDRLVSAVETSGEHQNATWNWAALVGVPPETQPSYTQTAIFSGPIRYSRR